MIHIAFNTNHEDKHPARLEGHDKNKWFAWYNDGFQNMKLSSVDDMVDLVQRGYGFTTWHKGRRHSNNFIAGQHVGLDMDHGDLRTLDALLRNEFISQHAAFAYTTPSHTEEDPRCRVVFVLDRPIKKRDKYVLLAQALHHKYQGADQANKDACRLFYGSSGCEVVIFGNTLTLETAASDLVEPYRRYVKQIEDARRAAAVLQRPVFDDRRLAALVRSIAERVGNAPDGQKYVTLRDCGRAVGGYVSAGYLSWPDAFTLLFDAITHNPNNVKNMEHAKAAVEEALNFGMRDPLYLLESAEPFETHAPIGLLTDLAHLPRHELEAISKIVEKEVTDAYWRGYHDALTEASLARWQRTGVPLAAVDLFGLGWASDERALTVPFRDEQGRTVDVEFRCENGTYTYNQRDPVLLHLDDDGGRRVVFGDSVEAMIAYLNFGHAEIDGERMTFTAAPHKQGISDALRGSDVVVVGPEITTHEFGVTNHLVRLPMSVSTLIGKGMEVDDFTHMITNA